MKNKYYLTINLILIFAQAFYLFIRFSYINDAVPFWYSVGWGTEQLAVKAFLWMIPLISSVIFIIGYFFMYLLRKYFVRYAEVIVALFVTVSNIIITYSLINIVLVSSSYFEPLISPLYAGLAVPFFAALIGVHLITPYFIEWYKRFGVVTSPSMHNHPGMVLESPSTRGGGMIFSLVFLLLGVFFVGFGAKFVGLYIGVFLLALLGIFDDFQNTHPSSQLRILENPVLRFFLLFSIVSVIVASGIYIQTVSNPFGGILNLNMYSLIAKVITMVWIVWVLNVLSWSNGIDGQYGGIVGISGLVVALLALRFVPLQAVHADSAVLAAIASGAAFGFTRHAWYPSKIMWGFGATAAGLVLSTLAILINTKITVSILIILVPFLDAAVTFGRRLIQRKNPFRGDRGHLHHILLDRGWSVPKVAMFYWFTTLVFGLIGLASSEQYIVQIGLFLVGVVGFGIILLNITTFKGLRAGGSANAAPPAP